MDGIRAAKAATTAAVTGATTISAVVISRVTAVVQCVTISTLVADQHHMASIRVPVDASRAIRDGCHRSVDKVTTHFFNI